MAWQDDLSLYDEPHGSEYFVVDRSVRPSVLYRLTGEVFSERREGQIVRPAEEVAEEVRKRGWDTFTS